MGCLWGAYLAMAGWPVTLLLRNAAALGAFPGHIVLNAPTGSRQVAVAAQLAETPGPTIDRLLVTVKAQDTLPALLGLKARLGPHTRVLLVQNGMGVVEEISREWPNLQLQVGSTTHGAYRKEAFQVVHAGWGETWLGVPLGLVAGEAWEVFRDLEGLDLNIHKDDDITTRMWDKLAINCAINPVTALLQCQNGEVLKSPLGSTLLGRICDESAQIMTTVGLDRQGSAIFEQVRRVASATAANYSSMCQDLRRGAVTEIDYMNGYLLRLGAAKGLSLPCNSTLVELVKLRQTLASPLSPP